VSEITSKVSLKKVQFVWHLASGRVYEDVKKLGMSVDVL
jgi:hypothetical protein